METLQEKIQNAKLTKKEKLVAEFFLRNQEQVVFMTSSNIARELGISDTSVIRFSRSLGFDTFNALKSFVQQEISEHIKTGKELSLLTPTERLHNHHSLLQNGSISQLVLDHTISSIKDVIFNNSESNIEQAATVIMDSQKKYIMGFRTAATIANYMGLILTMSLPNVITCSDGDSRAVEALIDCHKEDCLVLSAFSRYGQINQIVLDVAKERNAKIVVITDAVTAPVAKFADVLLVVNSQGLSFFNSTVAGMFICELLCTIIAQRQKESQEIRLDFVNKYISPAKMY